jgi:hypothetical protein
MRYLAFAVLISLNMQVHAQRYGTGLVFNDNNYAKAKIRAKFSSGDFENLPVAHSLKSYCPAPGNQLQLNTSPAWAIGWSANTILENRQSELTKSDNPLSPAYLYHQARSMDDQNCEAGLDLYETLEFFKTYKVEYFEQFLEFCPKYLPQNLQPRTDGKILDYRKLYEFNQLKTLKLNAVKKSISQNLPVVAGMHCPPSFFKARDLWQPAELMSFELPGQALCVIGYDDEKYGGAFEVMNSWGKDWGNNGFTWIRYDDFLNFARYAYEMFYMTDDEEKARFSGSVELKLNTNNPILMEGLSKGIFRSVHPFTTGTYFRIYLKIENPVFVYVFGVDQAHQVFRIFPYAENISPVLVYETDELTIPGEDNYIEVIGDPGQEVLCILYSKEAIDFDHLMKSLARFPGNLYENLDALLHGKVIDPNDIDWKNDSISFEVKNKSRSAILIQIQINHI